MFYFIDGKKKNHRQCYVFPVVPEGLNEILRAAL